MGGYQKVGEGREGRASLLALLRNPLNIFGLVLLAGDGPLVTAYLMSPTPSQAWVLLFASVTFIFGMGGFFCYLVACKPRHLYAPAEIPESAVGKMLYFEREQLKTIRDHVVSESRKFLEQAIEERRPPSLPSEFEQWADGLAERVTSKEKELFERTAADHFKILYMRRLQEEGQFEVYYRESSFAPDYVAIEELRDEGHCTTEEIGIDKNGNKTILVVARGDD